MLAPKGTRWSPLSASSQLIVVVAAFFVLLNCLQVQVDCFGSSGEIRDELDRIEDDGGFSEDMKDLQETRHDYNRNRKTSVENWYARMKIADLLVEIGQIKHAIRSKFVSISKTLLDKFDGSEENVDLREVELFLARCLVRSKITILLNTIDLWKQVYKFAERYRESVEKELEDLADRNVFKDPLNVDLELRVQERVLKRYEEFERAAQTNEDTNSNEAEADASNSSLELSTLEQIDILIDVAFNCEDDCLALAETPIAQRIPPLATSAAVELWRQEYIEKIYLEDLAQNEHILAELAVTDTKHRLVRREEWISLSVEQVEQFRRDLRGEENEAEYSENFNYFME